VFWNITTNTWQQKVCFNSFYDFGGKLLLYDLDHLRVRFPYDGKDWLVQIWKGCYTLVSNGAEIGIYEKPQSRKFNHFDSSQLMLPREVTLYHGKENMFHQDVGRTWWLTAFQPGPRLKPGEMTLKGSITFDDPGMQKAFWAAAQPYVEQGKATFQQKGRTVSFVF
jgi:hypothetical protein